MTSVCPLSTKPTEHGDLACETKTPATSADATSLPGARQGSLYLERILSDTLFGRVYVGRQLAAPFQQVAVKISLLKLSEARQSAAGHRCSDDITQEARVMRRLQREGGHDNVLRLISEHKTSQYHILVMEYAAGGDLHDRLEQHGAFAEEQVRLMTHDVLQGLRYIHAQGIAHLDLSLDNILIGSDGVLKITDFGCARRVGGRARAMSHDSDADVRVCPSSTTSSPPAATSSSFTPTSLTTSTVTKPPPITAPTTASDGRLARATSATAAVKGNKELPPGKRRYMAPEVYAGQDFNGQLADMFSLGVIVYHLFTCSAPFERPAVSDPNFRVFSERGLSTLLNCLHVRHLFSHCAVDFLLRLLTPAAEQRMTAEEALVHPWLLQLTRQRHEEEESALSGSEPPHSGK